MFQFYPYHFISSHFFPLKNHKYHNTRKILGNFIYIKKAQLINIINFGNCRCNTEKFKLLEYEWNGDESIGIKLKFNPKKKREKGQGNLFISFKEHTFLACVLVKVRLGFCHLPQQTCEEKKTATQKYKNKNKISTQETASRTSK